MLVSIVISYSLLKLLVFVSVLRCEVFEICTSFTEFVEFVPFIETMIVIRF